MTVVAWLVNPRSPPPRRRRLRILMRLMLTVILSLGFIVRNAILTPERVNNRRPLAIATPRAILYSAIMKGNPRVVTSLTPVRNVIRLIMKRSRRTWTDV